MLLYFKNTATIFLKVANLLHNIYKLYKVYTEA